LKVDVGWESSDREWSLMEPLKKGEGGKRERGR
jgi:hypothetical protein